MDTRELYDFIRSKDKFTNIDHIVTLLNYFLIDLEDEVAIDDFLEELEEVNDVYVYDTYEYQLFDEHNADDVLKTYQEDVIYDANEEMPDKFRSYFNFQEYAEAMYESLYDIYNDISEEFNEDENGCAMFFYVVRL